MATLALFAAGSLVGSTFGTFSFLGATITGAAIGGALGGAVGGIVDSMFVYPAIFKQKQADIQGPRLDDIRLQTASEGSPTNICFGPQNRVAGTLIWRSQIFEGTDEQKVSSGSGKKGQSSTVTTSVFSIHCAIAICEGDINNVMKIWADSKVIYDITGDTPIKDSEAFESMTIYMGTDTQEPDPLIQSFETEESTPAFRGTAYVVFEYLQMGVFGNRIPQFTFLVRGHSSLTVGSCITRLLYRAGISGDRIITSALTAKEVKGYALSGPQETNRAIESLLLTYDILAKERNGKLHFFERDDSSYVEVLEDDLAAHEPSQETPKDITVTEVADRQLPSRVVFSFIDEEADYGRGSINEPIINSNLPIIESYDVPLVMNAEDARAIAHRMLWSKYAERGQIEITLPPKYINIEEGDLLLIQSKDEVYSSRINELQIGDNYLIQVRATLEQIQTLRKPNLPYQPPKRPPNTEPYEAPDLHVELFTIAALSAEHYQKFGIYYAIATKNSDGEIDGNVAYRGGKLYSSPGGSDYVEIGTLPSRAHMGKVIDPIGLESVDIYDEWDDISELVVYMYSGKLESHPKASVYASNTLNRMLVNFEMIAFANAELIDEKTYKLTGLLRGLRGTDFTLANHSADERVILLTNSTIGFIELTNSEYNYPPYIRAVPYGSFVGDETDISLSGYEIWQTAAPLPVVDIQRDPSEEPLTNDLFIKWTRQSRAIMRRFETKNGPRLDPFEKYRVRFYSGSSTEGPFRQEVIVTVNINDNDDYPHYLWTADEQSGHGHTPGDTCTVTITPISPYDIPTRPIAIPAVEVFN
jgi:hypothetical protein